MKHLKMRLRYLMIRRLCELYRIFSRVQENLIRVKGGQDAVVRYHLRKIKGSDFSYFHGHMCITELYTQLGLDYMDSNLLVDLHHMGNARLDCPELRVYTEQYVGAISGKTMKEMKRLTVDYLIANGDLSQRFVDFKKDTIEEWINNDLSNTEIAAGKYAGVFSRTDI